jgi:transcriptional regulator with XRE-family HTH domain
MLELALTTQCCQEMLEYALERNSWSLARAAREIGVSTDYLRRIQAREQSFQVSDVEALAKALGLEAHELLFYSVKPESVPPKLRKLHDLAEKEIQRHREFSKIMTGKPTKKRQSRSTALAAKTSPKPAARRGFART